jgi:hypothetical protein
MSLIPLGILAASGAGGATAFESIATATGTGSAGNITFSSIPSTYQHLQIRALAQDTATQNFASVYYLRFNSDSGANYAWHNLSGDGTNVAATGYASFNEIYLSNSASRSGTTQTMGVSIIDILDYKNTSKNKTVRAFSGVDNNLASSGSYYVMSISGLWMSTAAISSITLIPNNSFSTRTTFALYGIKGA